MTGVSKYSDKEQLNIVEYIMEGHDLETAQSLLTPPPSIKTLKRWDDRWRPVILIARVEKDKADRQDRHNEILKGQNRHHKKKVRQDDSKFKGAQAAWQALYPSMIKRFTRFGYGNFVDFTEVVNDYFNKKEVDK